MKLIKDIKFFAKESPAYMQGHSKLYYWLHFPMAFFKFIYLSLKG